MNGDFAGARRSAQESWLILRAVRVSGVVCAAWRSSAIGSIVSASRDQFAATSLADRIRWIGTTLAIAAVAHLALRSMLSRTVVPALPAFLFAGIAAFGGIMAWQATAFERAWRQR